jgi:hypothetical protein
MGSPDRTRAIGKRRAGEQARPEASRPLEEMCLKAYPHAGGPKPVLKGLSSTIRGCECETDVRAFLSASPRCSSARAPAFPVPGVIRTKTEKGPV